MQTTRVTGIIAIFVVASIAWFILGSTVVQRTRASYENLNPRVQGLCGDTIAQIAPTAKVGNYYIDLERSDIATDIKLDYRRKGLLWFPIYRVNFHGNYTLVNPLTETSTISVIVPFPANKGDLDTFDISVNGHNEWQALNQAAVTTVKLLPGEKADIVVEYSTRGLRTWSYAFDDHVQHVKDFTLHAKTNFANIDFPSDTVSPTTKKTTEFTWAFKNRLSGFQIGITAPDRLNPGEVASRIAFFAPLGLLFFFIVVVVSCIIAKVNLHPIHFMFLSAGFFAFHLLFTYMVDHTSIMSSFLVSAGVSLLLVVNYMRLVVGLRFSLIPIAVSQFVYLILFSYAFFFKGYTGLTIAIGSIITLGVLMQVTAKVDWEKTLQARKPAISPGE
ncbi:MAG TPA: inner membrane CreD family protein [Armatimonadota bacterium]|nr:inner membrane CreD family protein [Armatimonadota bacterium]